MTQAELLIRFILGPVRTNIRPLVYAVELAVDLLFVQKIPMDDIHVTKDIYPAVAQIHKNRFGRSPSNIAVTRQIIRTCNECWEALVSRSLVLEYIGAPIKHIRAPSDMIFYLAFYIYLDKPFYIAVSEDPALLF